MRKLFTRQHLCCFLFLVSILNQTSVMSAPSGTHAPSSAPAPSATPAAGLNDPHAQLQQILEGLNVDIPSSSELLHNLEVGENDGLDQVKQSLYDRIGELNRSLESGDGASNRADIESEINRINTAILNVGNLRADLAARNNLPSGSGSGGSVSQVISRVMRNDGVLGARPEDVEPALVRLSSTLSAPPPAPAPASPSVVPSGTGSATTAALPASGSASTGSHGDGLPPPRFQADIDREAVEQARLDNENRLYRQAIRSQYDRAVQHQNDLQQAILGRGQPATGNVTLRDGSVVSQDRFADLLNEERSANSQLSRAGVQSLTKPERARAAETVNRAAAVVREDSSAPRSAGATSAPTPASPPVSPTTSTPTTPVVSPPPPRVSTPTANYGVATRADLTGATQSSWMWDGGNWQLVADGTTGSTQWIMKNGEWLAVANENLTRLRTPTGSFGIPDSPQVVPAGSSLTSMYFVRQGTSWVPSSSGVLGAQRVSYTASGGTFAFPTTNLVTAPASSAPVTTARPATPVAAPVSAPTSTVPVVRSPSPAGNSPTPIGGGDRCRFVNGGWVCPNARPSFQIPP